MHYVCNFSLLYYIVVLLTFNNIHVTCNVTKPFLIYLLQLIMYNNQTNEKHKFIGVSLLVFHTFL